MPISDPNELRRILETSRAIAVVGHSDKPHRTSYRIAGYLRSVGYRVYAVNPTLSEIDGERCYASLMDIPEPIDIVDVFRRSEYLDGIVDEAIAAGAKVVWTQLGVVDHKAAQKAEAAGLFVVMDHCIKVDHQALIGS